MKTITFYSYKGGVGRSLALANVASLLSKYDKQVCMLDFDLQAPGLHFKFEPQLKEHGQEIQRGIVDYIYEFSHTGNIPQHISEYSTSFRSTAQTHMTLIPAGNITSPVYWKKLSDIDWQDLLYSSPAGLYFLLDLKQKIEKELSPDYLLIDTRSGINEMSGIAVSLLADTVVVMAASSRENIEGTKGIIRRISDPQNTILRAAPQIAFVLSRLPVKNSPNGKEKEQNLVSKIKRELDSQVNDIIVLHSDRELEESQQAEIGYTDGPASPISGDYIRLFDKLVKTDLRQEDLERFHKMREGEDFYRLAQSEADLQKKLDLINHAIEATRLNEGNKSIYNIEFLLFRASIYEQLGNWKKVTENCEMVLNQDTANVSACEVKGWAQVRMNDYQEAKLTFETVLTINKNRISAKKGLADILAYEENYEESLTLYNEIIRTDMEDATGYLGRAKIELLMHEINPALEDVYQALMLNTDYVEAYLTLAEINAQRQNNQEFYLNLEKALKLNTRAVIPAILANKMYARFQREIRFQTILEKYDIGDRVRTAHS